MKFFRSCTPMFMNAGEVVYEKGQQANRMYIIIKGRACTLASRVNNSIFGNPLKVQIFIQGTHFGFLDIMNLCRRTHTVQVEVFSELWSIRSQEIWELMKEFPDFADEVKMIGSQRLKHRYSTVSYEECH